MEIIDELETSRRGLYAGVVGYLDFAGDMDTAIAIRTAVVRDGRAYVQAGGGWSPTRIPPQNIRSAATRRWRYCVRSPCLNTMRPPE